MSRILRNRRWLLLLALAALTAACTRPVEPLPVIPTPTATVPTPVTFPRDALPHDALTEWWYYTGHLTTADNQPYGFEFTIFQVRRQDAPTVYVAHFAISDISGQRFLHQARFVQGDAQPMPLDVQGWHLTSEPTSGDTISAALTDGPSLNLHLTDQKPPVLHHGGYIDEGPSIGGSYYYSRTRLAVTGDLSGTPLTGLAWMDHQWGNFVVPAASLGGWDWYSLQLDDGSDLMLYVLRGVSGQTVFGSLVAPDGQTRDLAPNEVQAQATGYWTSPHTGAEYPSGWQLHLPQGNVVLTPQLQDQELYFPAAPTGGLPAYWEGAVTISGDHTGQGYVELTGYAQ